MKEKIFIFGKNINQSDIETIKEDIQNVKEKNLQKIDGEYEKTEEEIKFIQAVNKYFTQEFKDLGIVDIPEITPEEFHFLPSSIYGEKHPEKKDSDGAFNFRDQVVYISKDRMQNRLYEFQTIMHEAVHLIAFKKINLRPNEGPYGYRTGYMLSNFKGKTKRSEPTHDHFSGLDEAIVDRFTIEIIEKNMPAIKEEFNINDQEINESYVGYYWGLVKILTEIIKKVAKTNGKSKKEVWKDFKRGEFTGEMLHLREVEKTFGSGALRVLGALNSSKTRQRMYKETEIKRISDYFKAESQEERDLLASQILNKNELAKYNKRKEASFLAV